MILLIAYEKQQMNNNNIIFHLGIHLHIFYIKLMKSAFIKLCLCAMLHNSCRGAWCQR